jgi:aspartate/methionine/tyrosine aminotransferase
VQVALPALLGLRRSIQRQIIERVRHNSGLVERKLVVEAGWYAVIPVLDEEETALGLLRDHNVLVQPGYFYDFERSGYLVVSLLTRPEIFEEGIRYIRSSS